MNIFVWQVEFLGFSDIKNSVIVIAGPTASGKSAVAIETAKKLNTEIISADSMQIYKGLDIGTAKVTEAETDGIIHHMIDIIEADCPFNVNDYSNMATEIIEKIHQKGKIPIIAGGTGLYINSVIYNFNLQKAESDELLREELTEMYEKNGGEYMLSLLREFDPETADRLHPNNHRRIIRAIEMYKTSGITMSEQLEITKKTKNKFNVKFFVLNTDREILYDRINRRVDKMLENGLLNEVDSLLEKGIPEDTTSMQAIGYKEILLYKKGLITLEEAIDKIKMESRRYAKRQLTWFRRNEEAIWIDTRDFCDNPEKIAEYITNSLS